MKAADRLLLDTHVWLWLALGVSGQLSPAAIRTIEAVGQTSGVLVSIVSIWELALLEMRQRVVLPLPLHDWVQLAFDRSEIKLVGLSRPRTVLDSVRLPGEFHADPADRFLVATARARRATLVTRDEKIVAYGKAGHVKVMAV